MSERVPVWMEQRGDVYVATRLLPPVVCATGATREEAAAALARSVRDYVGSGEYVTVEWPSENEGGAPVLTPPPSAEEEEFYQHYWDAIYEHRAEMERAEAEREAAG